MQLLAKSRNDTTGLTIDSRSITTLREEIALKLLKFSGMQLYIYCNIDMQVTCTCMFCSQQSHLMNIAVAVVHVAMESNKMNGYHDHLLHVFCDRI